MSRGGARAEGASAARHPAHLIRSGQVLRGGCVPCGVSRGQKHPRRKGKACPGATALLANSFSFTSRSFRATRADTARSRDCSSPAS